MLSQFVYNFRGLLDLPNPIMKLLRYMHPRLRTLFSRFTYKDNNYIKKQPLADLLERLIYNNKV